MKVKERIREMLGYVFVVIVTLAILQSLVVVMHEFTHSTVAWLLGYTSSPFTVVWGNPLTMTGWDEGVHYSRLFPSGNNVHESIIGASPLALHTFIVALCLVVLQKRWMTGRKKVVHVMYWFMIANFMELIAYIVMRSFASGGDTGHFNRGLGLSPWILFVVGTLFVIFGLYVLFGRVMPVMYNLFARGNCLTEWAILSITAFFLFLWGSGIRVVLYVRPDPQWMFGLIGFAAFVVVLFVYNPSRRTSKISTKSII